MHDRHAFRLCHHDACSREDGRNTALHGNNFEETKQVEERRRNRDKKRKSFADLWIFNFSIYENSKMERLISLYGRTFVI